MTRPLLPGQLLLVVPAIAIVAADQLSKRWIAGRMPLGAREDVTAWFAWVHAQNPGASFSFLADSSGWQRWLFIGIAVLFSGWLLRELARLGPQERWPAWGYALILGGALGNLWDRIEQGAVTDFVLVHWFDRAYFPAFNLADTAITIGAGIWIALLVLETLGRGPFAHDHGAAPSSARPEEERRS